MKIMYRPLEKTLSISGTGLPNLSATEIKREGRICLYERSDGNFEVFIVQNSPGETLFGKTYPPRETYPANEDFGKIAFCFTSREYAERKYEKLIEGG